MKMSISNRVTWLAGVLCALMSVGANATVILPSASNWSVTITDLNSRASGAPTTSITDVFGSGTHGVQFDYSAPTGGSGVGTRLRQYDFTTSAPTAGTLPVSIDYVAFTGFFITEASLEVIVNGTVTQVLSPFTTSAPTSINLSFTGIAINVNPGDVYGIRAKAGNFTQCCGVNGTITLSQVPEPGTVVLLGAGLLGLGARRRFLRPV